MERDPTAFDWDKIVSKDVWSKDTQNLGKIAEIDTDSFIILLYEYINIIIQYILI